ncbi:DUF167 domain-containing protein [bacterium]|nr:DUF167 domain-containing protein [bacterium]
MNWFRVSGNKIALAIYVQPGAKQNRIVGLHGQALKIRLAAPSIEGRANEALIKYLATLCGVPIRQVVINKGEKSRSKVVVITDSTIEPHDILIQSE